ncbi:MAG: anti-phage deoxyguanosine triphosphatase [Gammaproteobacteria bacterium]|nr:anti-phage deoxyguanosine triphosphatase [Gammaproteobacteria bacterium]
MWIERRSGHTHQRSQFDHRSPFERDKTRVIHCPAFRRLQRKTQILGPDEGDFHRTRLTHSLEVASIGVSIVRHLQRTHQPTDLATLLPTDDLITVICLLHDIGHPPFGHGGEVALNYMMHAHGGFEGNGQTLRLLTKIESSYGDFGLDLTRRCLLGILKYPAPRHLVVAKKTPNPMHHHSKTIRINDWLPPKAYFNTEQPEIDWLLSPFSKQDRDQFQSLSQHPSDHQHGKTAHQSLDCSMMNIADDIAYGIHDLEDAIHLKLIHRDQIDVATLQQHLSNTSLANPTHLIDLLFHADMHKRKEAIGELVNYFITTTQLTPSQVPFENPLLNHKAVLQPEAEILLAYLVETVYRHVIDATDARTFEFRGQTIILHLFEALNSNPMSLLDQKYRALYQQAPHEDEAYRILCDYIANMTDEYAHRLHDRLFGFHHRG